MKHLARISGSSLALLLTLMFGSAQGQDATYDVTAKDPAVAAELEAKEEELDAFFEAAEQRDITRESYDPETNLDAREESALLKRANREATEFNDIDADDLAELDRDVRTDAEPRLEKPGQLEKDIPLTCPLGSEAQDDGTCLAGPDWTFED